MRSHDLRCLQSRAAGMAHATRGRNTRFPSAREMRSEWDDAEAQEAIEEGKAAFEARKAEAVFENRYCPKERESTRHKVKTDDGMTTYTCEVCGSVKFPVQFIRNVMR